MKNHLSAKQAAEILDCSPDHILELRKRGLLKGYRYRRRLWRFRREDVEQLASGKEQFCCRGVEGAEVSTTTPPKQGRNASHMSKDIESKYLVTDIRLLLPETVNEFDLFIRHGRFGERYLLYCPKGEIFTEQHLERLLNWGVTEFYISAGEEGVFKAYLDKNLESLLRDFALDSLEKGKVVYEACLYNLEAVFRHPKAEFIRKSKETMRHTVEYILTANREFVRQMIRLITHDPSTYHHSGNVGLLGVSLMKELFGGSDRDLYDMGYALFLHDIGKSRIDPSILNKPGRLSDPEWEIMKTHPEKGHQILSEEGCVTPEAEVIVLQHHERPDGKGYPQGLRSEQIDPLARLCNIVDSYDALMTKRPYKESMTSFQALEIMKREMRGQFDLDLFERFVRLLE